MHRHPALSLLAAAVLATACGGAGRIAQPTVTDLPVADEVDRVDLATPTFSNPTEITNPLFPVSRQASVLLVGTVDGEPFRTEVTLLDRPRIIEWAGQRVATLVSQYVAFLGGHLHEVAYDYYAQADDGSVWYFGEDVFNFADGAIVDTHGTWIAGTDGPAAMIMPAEPNAGDAYRPENIPGLVFEEVTVADTGVALDGPLGLIEDGIVVSELHMDGATEEKTFAPGYGEFFTSSGGDTEALALAVPTDAADAPVPDALASLAASAQEALGAAVDGDDASLRRAAAGVAGTWAAYDEPVPALIRPLVDEAVDALTAAADDGELETAARAAIEVARLALDLELRHRPVVEIDVARLGLWAEHLRLDAAADDEAAVMGDLFALDYTRERVAHALAAEGLAELNLALEELHGLRGDGDMEAVGAAALELVALVDGLAPPG